MLFSHIPVDSIQLCNCRIVCLLCVRVRLSQVMWKKNGFMNNNSATTLAKIYIISLHSGTLWVAVFCAWRCAQNSWEFCFFPAMYLIKFICSCSFVSQNRNILLKLCLRMKLISIRQFCTKIRERVSWVAHKWNRCQHMSWRTDDARKIEINNITCVSRFSSWLS